MDANQRIAFRGVLVLVHRNTSQLYEHVHPLPLASPSQPAPRVITERLSSLRFPAVSHLLAYVLIPLFIGA